MSAHLKWNLATHSRLTKANALTRRNLFRSTKRAYPTKFCYLCNYFNIDLSQYLTHEGFVDEFGGDHDVDDRWNRRRNDDGFVLHSQGDHHDKTTGSRGSSRRGKPNKFRLRLLNWVN